MHVDWDLYSYRGDDLVCVVRSMCYLSFFLFLISFGFLLFLELKGGPLRVGSTWREVYVR